MCMETGDTLNRIRPTSDQVDKCLLIEKASLYIETLSQILVGLPIHGRCDFKSIACTSHKIYDEKLRKFGNDWPPFGFTMTGSERMENFRAAINEVNRNGINGAIIELGVWRGGAMVLAAALQKESKITRELYLFDAFGELPNGGYGTNKDFLAVDIASVKSAFTSFGLFDEEHVHFVKGLFQETTITWKNKTDPIAVLRIDGNFYDSYQDAMYSMYDNVEVGGIVIFDDVMSHKPVMQCWQDFKNDHGLPEELVRIDDHSAWFRKKKDIKIEWSLKHEAIDVNK